MPGLFYSSIFGELTKQVQIRIDTASQLRKRLFDQNIYERYLDWDTPTVGLNFEEIIGQYNLSVAAATLDSKGKEPIMGTEGFKTLKEKVLAHQMSYSMPIEDYRKVLQVLDSRMLTDEQKTLVNGIKVNDVYSFNGWYSMKRNSDGSMAFCLTYENLLEDGRQAIPMAFYVKEVTGDHMLLFNGDFDENDNPNYMEAVSLEKSSVTPGTFYDQRVISELPHIENVDAEVQ